MASKVWEEITYPFPNFNGCTTEVWDTLYNECDYLSMLGLGAWTDMAASGSKHWQTRYCVNTFWKQMLNQRLYKQ